MIKDPFKTPGLGLSLTKSGRISHTRRRSENFYPHTERVVLQKSPRETFKKDDYPEAALTSRGSVGISLPTSIPTIISDKRITQGKRTIGLFSTNFLEQEEDPRRKLTRRSNFHQDLDKNATLKDIQKISNLTRIQAETKKKAGKMFVTDLWSQKHFKKIRNASGITEQKDRIEHAKRNPQMYKLKALEQYFGRRHTQETTEVASWIKQLENEQTIKIFDENPDVKSQTSTREQSLQNEADFSQRQNTSSTKHMIDLNTVKEENIEDTEGLWLKHKAYNKPYFGQKRFAIRSIPLQEQQIENQAHPTQITTSKQNDSCSKANKLPATSGESEAPNLKKKLFQKQRGSLSDISTNNTCKQSRSRSAATLDYLPSTTEVSSEREECPANSRFQSTMSWILNECDKQAEKKIALSPRIKNNIDKLLATQKGFKEKLRFYKIRKLSGDGLFRLNNH